MTESTTTEWETPDSVFHPLNEEFDFTIDVCATPSTAKCKRYYTRANDGLAKDWRGERCWMNPPYGRSIYQWVQKAAQTAQEGGLVVALVYPRTDTAWWHNFIWDVESHTPRQGVSLRFLRGRVYFGTNGDFSKPAPAPSVVVVFDGRKNVYCPRTNATRSRFNATT